MSAAAHLGRLRENLHGPLTLGELTAKLGREGAGLLVFLLSLPFLQPIPLAGLGTPVGVLLIAVGVQLLRGHHQAMLPGFAARRTLEGPTVARLLTWAHVVLAFIERWARPRKRGEVSARACGLAIIALGVIFACPIFVPLGNPLSAAPLACLGLALLEEDALYSWLGCLGTAATLAYHTFFLRLFWLGARALAR